MAREVEEMNAEESDDETEDEGNGVCRVVCVEALEEDEGGYDDRRREADIVHRVNSVVERQILSLEDGAEEKGDVHIGRKGVEGLVEIVELDNDAENHHNSKDVGARVRELIFTAKRELDGDAKTFYRHDRHGTRYGTDGDVDHGIFLAMFGYNMVDHDEAEDKRGEAEHEEAYTSSAVVF